MEQDDYEGWLRLRDSVPVAQVEAAATPCVDCYAEFADEMRAIGRCDGEPVNVEERAVSGLTLGQAASAKVRRAKKLERAAAARELYRSGLIKSEVARRLGLSRSAIRKYELDGLL